MSKYLATETKVTQLWAWQAPWEAKQHFLFLLVADVEACKNENKKSYSMWPELDVVLLVVGSQQGKSKVWA